MESDKAKLLIANLVERLSREGTHFNLPGGRLSESEVGALKALAGIPTIADGEPASATSAKLASLALNLGALDRKALAEMDLRLCLDFGTAMSKAWATGSVIEKTFPLVLGRPADGIDVLAVPSSIFITKTGHVFFGAAAERQHEAEIHLGRQRFDNIKRLLSETEPGLDLDEVPLENGIDPTESGLTKGDLIVLYLGWLTDMALKALETTVREIEPSLSGKYPDVRAVFRRFAIPCFEHAVDDVPSSVRAKWADTVMRSALVRAQIIADTLGSKWNDLHAAEAKAALSAVRSANLTALDLFCKPGPIREPIAAGATRFHDFIEEQGADAARARRLMLVIDSGAGTTDFALFQSFYDADKEEASFALIRNAVGMSRIAGNRFDTVLRPLVLKACKIHPENGAPWNDEEFSIIKADLSSQIRSLKQQLFSTGRISISLRPGASGILALKDLEGEIRYQELGQNLIEQRNTLLRNALEGSIERFREINSRLGRPVPIYVLLTGGSGRLPPVMQLAEGELVIGGAKFEFESITDTPKWIQELPRSLSELIAREFPQCAVAIGGSAPELPKEKADLSEPITPPADGVRRLERFQVTGT